LAKYPNLKYIGTDVVKKLLSYAAKRTGRDDFRFVVADDYRLPAADSSLDFVAFFQ
jgi:ubiquinone/menaquinone biosynthesis C-methylase UbiE